MSMQRTHGILLASFLFGSALCQEPPKPPDEPAKAEAKAPSGAGAERKKEAKAELRPEVRLVKLEGRYADLAEQSFDPAALLTGGGKPPKPFFDLLDRIDDLGRDEKTSTILLDLSAGASFNQAQIRELERALQRVRGAGKKLYCYLESADPTMYRVACQCDRILLADMGMVDLRSPAMFVMFLKDAFDLLGVRYEVSRVGAFKGAVEPYIRSEMSDHLREHYRQMLASVNEDVVRSIAAGRKLKPEQVREMQKKRLFLAREAMVAGLVDRVVPRAGARRALAAELGGDEFDLTDALPKAKRSSRDLFSLIGEMLRGSKDPEIDEARIVVLHLSGAIVDGKRDVPGSIVSGPTVARIDKLAENDEVKGVVVRVNSPGGSATASEAVRLALQRLAAKKPVVYSMGDVAASGGYWITAIGRPILAEPGTITGSIGVFSLRLETGPLMRRFGLHLETVALDESAEWDAGDRPMADEARERVQAFVDDVYERFVSIVAESRRLDRKFVDEIGGGRVWSGSQAVERKLVDSIGGLDDAIAMVVKECGGPEDIEVEHLPRPRSFADAFFSDLFETRSALDLREGIALLGRRFGSLDSLIAVLRDSLANGAPAKVWAMLPGCLALR